MNITPQNPASDGKYSADMSVANACRYITCFRRIGDRVRELDPDYMSAKSISVFLHICCAENCTMQSLAADLNLAQTGVSRVVSYLGTTGERCLGLVEAVEDPADRRRKFVRLTPKGNTLRQEICETLSHCLVADYSNTH